MNWGEEEKEEKMSKKLNLMKILLTLLGVSSSTYGAEDTKEARKFEEQPTQQKTEMPTSHEGCQTYIPRSMKFVGYDNKRDVALYRDVTPMPFWERVKFLWGSDNNIHH